MAGCAGVMEPEISSAHVTHMFIHRGRTGFSEIGVTTVCLRLRNTLHFG